MRDIASQDFSLFRHGMPKPTITPGAWSNVAHFNAEKSHFSDDGPLVPLAASPLLWRAGSLRQGEVGGVEGGGEGGEEKGRREGRDEGTEERTESFKERLPHA